MSHRIAQIESTLKRVLAQTLDQRLADPRIEGLVSITRVTVSPDLHDAFIYVSIMPQKYEKRTMHGLQHASGYIHSLVREGVALRTVPRLEFRLDETIKRQAQVDEALRRGTTRMPPQETNSSSAPPAHAAGPGGGDQVLEEPNP